jgi:hypothetical protein
VLNNLDNNEGNILKSISYVGCDLLWKHGKKLQVQQ